MSWSFAGPFGSMLPDAGESTSPPRADHAPSDDTHGAAPTAPASASTAAVASDAPLRPLAEDVATNDDRIDRVAVAPDGGLIALFDVEGDEGDVLTRALAAIAWLTRHGPDWCKLAPGLGIDATQPVRARVRAQSFTASLRDAAAVVGEHLVTLELTAPAAAAAPPVESSLATGTRAAAPGRREPAHGSAQPDADDAPAIDEAEQESAAASHAPPGSSETSPAGDERAAGAAASDRVAAAEAHTQAAAGRGVSHRATPPPARRPRLGFRTGLVDADLGHVDAG